jgi:ribonuclease J
MFKKQKRRAVRRNTGRPSATKPEVPQKKQEISVGKIKSTKSTKPTKFSKSKPKKYNKKKVKTAPIPKGTLRIIPLGGCEEVGRNMTVFEYENDIVILDMGLQFPEEDMPGIDFIVPNTKYLEGKEKNIRGVIFSHGHLDHIGAAPILLEKLGNPTIVGRDLTLALVKHKQEDYNKGSSKKLKTIRINTIKDVIKLGEITIKFFQVEHSIMDAVGVIIETPHGTAIHPGDWTMERGEDGKSNLSYKHLRNLKKPTALLLESLGSTNTTRHGSYEEMYKNLQGLLSKAPGRIIIGTFSSQIERVKWVLKVAEKLGKKVALEGYSMKMNIEIAQKLGYIKIKKGILIETKNIGKLKDNQIIVIGTGAQGEKNAMLSRIVNRQHRFIKLKKSDTVIFSSSVIPGNERTIQRLKDNVYRQCDRVIHGEIMDVHVSGHATRQDILDIIAEIDPTYFIPVYANHYMLKEAAWLAQDNGFKADNIFVPDNGSIIEVNNNTAKKLEKKVPTSYVFVDGLGVSDTQNIVIRDRQVLAEDGMVVVIATIDAKTGKLIQNPDIISRGFVFLKENKKLIEDLRHKVKKMVILSDPSTWADTNQIRNDIRDKVGQFLFSKTEKRPMVMSVIIEV